jgi:TonB family protein
MIRATVLVAMIAPVLGSGAFAAWWIGGSAFAERQATAAQPQLSCAPPLTGMAALAGSSGQWLIDAGARGELAYADTLPVDSGAARVFVDFDGSIYWGENVVSLVALKDEASKHMRDKPGKPVRVEWHRLVTRGLVLAAVSAINATGIGPVLVQSRAAEPAQERRIQVERAGKLVELTEPAVDQAALLARLRDYYPLAAAKEGRAGETTVSMCIGPEGLPRNLRVVRSSGHADLDKAAIVAITAIPSVRFHPACDASGAPVDWCRPPFITTIVWDKPE